MKLKAAHNSYKEMRERCDLNDCRTCPGRKVCDGMDNLLFHRSTDVSPVSRALNKDDVEFSRENE